VQLLWINLIGDGAPAVALGFNPPDHDVMQRPPRSREDGLIDSWSLVRFSLMGAYIGLATVAPFVLWYLNDQSVFGVFSVADGHSAVTWQQLTSFHQCQAWPDFNPSLVYSTGGGGGARGDGRRLRTTLTRAR